MESNFGSYERDKYGAEMDAVRRDEIEYEYDNKSKCVSKVIRKIAIRKSYSPIAVLQNGSLL